MRQYEAWKQEVQHLRLENQHLRLELMAARPELYHSGNRVAELEERVEKLEAENKLLKQRVKELTLSSQLISKQTSAYDDQGDVYQTSTYSVDRTSGAVSALAQSLNVSLSDVMGIVPGSSEPPSEDSGRWLSVSSGGEHLRLPAVLRRPFCPSRSVVPSGEAQADSKFGG